MKKKRQMKPRSGVEVPRVIKRRFPDVTKCIDAPKAIVVEVTEADGKGGNSADFENCALARAACRQEHADAAVVSKRVIYVIKDGVAVRYATSERIRNEITSYDRHHEFAEGEYPLRPKRPSERLGVQHHRFSAPDRRKRHDESKPAFMRSPRVRDLNVADARPKKKGKKRAA